MTRETILLVEDSLQVQAIARRFLETAGYEVITASDGEEGLRIYKQLHSSIGLLLTDVKMPRVNGLDLANRVQQLDSQLPILLMSGDILSSDLSFSTIAKPFTRSALVDFVCNALDASEKRQERELVR